MKHRWLEGFLLVGLVACAGDGAPPEPDRAAAPLPASEPNTEPNTEPTPHAETAPRPVVSLLGRPLLPAPIPAERLARLTADLDAARARWRKQPDDPGRIIWLGRRTAYLGRYDEAIAIYTRGLELHPDEPRLLRHRGHRYITTRRLKRAAADLERAARLVEGHPDEVEPDGIPNRLDQPRSTLHSNIWYHLGLVRYLQGDFAAARRCYRSCLEVSRNDDMVVATTHWLYATCRRLGRDDEAYAALAPVHESMDIVENHAYHRLLLMYKGELTPGEVLSRARGDESSFATVAYGVAAWHLYDGRETMATTLLEEILRQPAWAAFGFIAAEAEMARR